VRRRSGVDGEAAGIADVRDVVQQLEVVDEGAAGLAAAFKFEAKQATVAAREILVGAGAGFAILS